MSTKRSRKRRSVPGLQGDQVAGRQPLTSPRALHEPQPPGQALSADRRLEFELERPLDGFCLPFLIPSTNKPQPALDIPPFLCAIHRLLELGCAPRENIIRILTPLVNLLRKVPTPPRSLPARDSRHVPGQERSHLQAQTHMRSSCLEPLSRAFFYLLI